MKWFTVAILAAFTALPMVGQAQERLPIGNIPQISDNAPSLWAYSGYEIFKIRTSDGANTPIMRTETYDARLVEILSRTQAPPLRASDIHVKDVAGHHYIVVRNYLLLEVKPQDAQAEGTTIGALAHKWANSSARVLPQIQPWSNRIGI